MSDWGITTKVPAEVVLVEEIVLAGDLHLFARPTYPPGPETPLEMLNRDDEFFALTIADGVRFIPKAQVLLVSCRHQAPLVDPERASAAKLIGLAVVLQGGREVLGHASLELPPQRGRALDYLNGPGVFFVLGADDVSWFINKSRVRFARPLD